MLVPFWWSSSFGSINIEKWSFHFSSQGASGQLACCLLLLDFFKTWDCTNKKHQTRQHFFWQMNNMKMLGPLPFLVVRQDPSEMKTFDESLPQNTCVSLDDSSHFCHMLGKNRTHFVVPRMLGPKTWQPPQNFGPKMGSSPNPCLFSFKGWNKAGLKWHWMLQKQQRRRQMVKG